MKFSVRKKTLFFPDNWFKNEKFNAERTPAYFRYIPDLNEQVVNVPEDPYVARVDYVKMSPNNYTDIGETGVIYANGKDKFLRSGSVIVSLTNILIQQV